MGHPDSQGPGTSETQPPLWWIRDGAEVPLESLETDPLPDGTRPDDIPKLHELIRFLARENRLLRERLDAELKHRYGSHSEKRPRGSGKGKGDPSPSSGSGSAPGSDSSSNSSATGIAGPAGTGDDASGKKRPGHGRRDIPPGLEQEEQEVPLKKSTCKRCKGPTHHVESVKSYRFHFKPGRIVLRVYVRSRRACNDPTCDGPFRIAKLPPEPIPKGRATAGFLAHLFVTKFADHCPLYRFRKILLRQNVDLPRSTLVDYCKKTADLLKPLWEVMRKRILESAIIGTDDTYVQVRLPRKKGVLKGHLWAYRGDDEHPYVVFEFTPNWEAKATQNFLATFKGYIQADGYKGYDKLFEDPARIEVGCMAHARRKWVKAQKSSPQVAEEALKLIGQLYAIEAECKSCTPDERKAARQARSAPILETLRVWVEDQKTSALPKGTVAAAIEYMQNQWVALTRFLEDGRLSIDNNAVERDLRAVALGRKNWMAAGSEVGGATAAIGFTMIASAVRCGVDPVEWLADVLERIVTCPPERLHELLPDQWKAARDAEKAARRAAADEEQRRKSTGVPSEAERAHPEEADAIAPSASPTPTGTCAADSAPPSPAEAPDEGALPKSVSELRPPEHPRVNRQPGEPPPAGRSASTLDARADTGAAHDQPKGPRRTARAPP